MYKNIINTYSYLCSHLEVWSQVFKISFLLQLNYLVFMTFMQSLYNLKVLYQSIRNAVEPDNNKTIR